MPRKAALNGRLRAVQEKVGYKSSLRAFREELLNREFWRERGEPAPSFSYEAVRNYHLDRDPPSSYLVAVVERWDVNPAWLLRGGEALMFMKDVREAQSASLGEADHPLWPPALSGVPELAGWPTPAKVLFLDTLADYVWSFEGSEILFDETEQRRFEALEALARDLFGMVSVTYLSMREGLSRREFTQYLIALLHAVQLRIPDGGQGPHLFTRFHSLDPEWVAWARAQHPDNPEYQQGIASAIEAPLK